MFIVFNKEKINSYLVSIGTVTCLLVIGFMMNKNNSKEVSTHLNEHQNIYTNIIQNEINE